MPNIDFVLPHWAYWAGLIIFPLVAMVLARRTRREEKTYSLALGYFILITGGILGLHRFYMKNLWGLAFLPIFAFVLYANSVERDARATLSDADNVVRIAERTIEREEPRVESSRKEIEALTAEVADAEEGSFAKRSAERRLERAQERVRSGEQRLAEAHKELETTRPAAAKAKVDRAFWGNAAKDAFYAILALMALDALIMPWLMSGARARMANEPEENEIGAGADEVKEDIRHVSTGWTGVIDRISLYAGEFVSYWAVIAVFVYYFEVVSRYVFNSPTNWAHEAMYLMFGMQYLIAGAYAMLTEAHVRVDIFYAPLPRKKKAWVDLVTSIFFFIFAGTLLATSYIFALDAVAVSAGNSALSEWARGDIDFGGFLSTFSLSELWDPEIRMGEFSFNEWEVALWPMKWMMFVGGVLLVLQGVSKMAQDVRAIARGN